MPYIHNISTRIGGRRASLHFYMERRKGGKHLLPIPRVHQYDNHSCGFLAALVVAQYFDPSVTVWDVLEAMPLGWQPSPKWGLPGWGIRETLSYLGIECPSSEGLGWADLMEATMEGNPVIATLDGPDWICDHWVVIRGMKDRKVWLSNYDWSPAGRLSWKEFSRQWSPHGEAMICRKV